jgi:hypothetical protein
MSDFNLGSYVPDYEFDTPELIKRLRTTYFCTCTMVGKRCRVCTDRIQAAETIENLQKDFKTMQSIANIYKNLWETSQQDERPEQ